MATSGVASRVEPSAKELADAIPDFRPEENYRRRAWEFRARERGLATVAGAAMVEFLIPFPWEWYFTGTFRGTPNLGRVHGAWRRLIEDLALRGSGFPVGRGAHPWMVERALQMSSTRYFRCTELQQRNVPHFHALFYGVNDVMRRVDVKEWWFERFGIARVEPYDPDLGAVGYVGKYVLKDTARSGDWDIELDPLHQARIEFSSGGPARGVAPAAGPAPASLRVGGSCSGNERDTLVSEASR
jgi:hypothetical protein